MKNTSLVKGVVLHGEGDTVLCPTFPCRKTLRFTLEVEGRHARTIVRMRLTLTSGSKKFESDMNFGADDALEFGWPDFYLEGPGEIVMHVKVGEDEYATYRFPIRQA